MSTWISNLNLSHSRSRATIILKLVHLVNCWIFLSFNCSLMMIEEKPFLSSFTGSVWTLQEGSATALKYISVETSVDFNPLNMNCIWSSIKARTIVLLALLETLPFLLSVIPNPHSLLFPLELCSVPGLPFDLYIIPEWPAHIVPNFFSCCQLCICVLFHIWIGLAFRDVIDGETPLHHNLFASPPFIFISIQLKTLLVQNNKFVLESPW